MLLPQKHIHGQKNHMNTFFCQEWVTKEKLHICKLTFIYSLHTLFDGLERNKMFEFEAFKNMKA